MKKTLLLLSMLFVLAFFSIQANAQQNTVIINEFSNGTAGTAQDWIELVVTANNTDLRGLYLTTYNKNGGLYPVSGSATADLTKGIRLKVNNSDLTNLAKGTIIVIYNSAARDNNIFPATDDLNILSDATLLIPSNDPNYIEAGSTWPGFTAWDGITSTHNGICIYSSDLPPNTAILTGIFCVDYGSGNFPTGEFNTGYGQVLLPSTTTFAAGHGIYFDAGTTGAATDITNWKVETDLNSSPKAMNSTGNEGLPVELTSFTASVVNGTTVNLTWNTATEVNNYGFDIERSSGNEGWQKIGFVAGNGNSNSPKEYSFTDNPSGGTSFSYRLKQIDINGAFKYYDAVKVNLTASSKPQLLQNNPNPFNPSTTIKFYTPNTSDVSIKIYDMLGREVLTLFNKQTTAGFHIVYWNGKDSRGENVASGVYLYRLTAGSFSETKKMNLLK